MFAHATKRSNDRPRVSNFGVSGISNAILNQAGWGGYGVASASHSKCYICLERSLSKHIDFPRSTPGTERLKGVDSPGQAKKGLTPAQE